MKSRKAFKTKDGDIQIERRNIALVEGKEEIEQYRVRVVNGHLCSVYINPNTLLWMSLGKIFRMNE